MRVTSVLAMLASTHAAIPTVQLYNAAQPGLTMPAIGLGTGGYASTPNGTANKYPECWSEPNCGNYTAAAVKAWLLAGGRRLDAANSYGDMKSVGIGLAASGVDRKDVFLLQKVGNSLSMGYNDVMLQFDDILSQMNVTYVDLLLIHWPTSPAKPVDVVCDMSLPDYNATACRLNTWRALVDIFNAGQARAIGVSNYNATHIQEIIDAGLPLPSVNQIPFHLYRSSSQNATIQFSNKLRIQTIAYSPLGVPDWHAFPAPLPSPLTLTDPVVVQIAAAHQATPAQVLIAWQWALGIPCNPRTMNETHMQENMDAYAVQLTSQEVAALSSRPQDLCSFDRSFYECYDPAGDLSVEPPTML